MQRMLQNKGAYGIANTRQDREIFAEQIGESERENKVNKTSEKPDMIAVQDVIGNAYGVFMLVVVVWVIVQTQLS